MIHVVALVTAKPGKRAELLKHFSANVPKVHAEEGCIEYGAATDLEGAGRIQTPVGPDTVVVIEKWASLEALKAHGSGPVMTAYAEKTRDLVAGRTIHVLGPVEG